MDDKSQFLVAALIVAGSSAAVAQSGPVRPQYQFPEAPAAATGAGAAQIGDSAFYVSPLVSTAFGRDDNLFLSNTNERTSWVWLLSPGVTIDARGPSRVFQLHYMGTLGRYTNSSEDNYVDHTVRASFDVLATRQLAFRAGYEFLRGHDPRGSTDRPQANRPDTYESHSPSVLVAFGQRDAKGRIEASYSESEKRYQNNRAFTTGSDRDTKEAGVAGYFRVMPRTQIVAEYRKTDLEYISALSPFSGEEERIYGGVTWEATAATSGTLKGGRLTKKFDRGIAEFSGTGWEGQITWLPRSYSKFDFFTYRQPVESTGQGNFVLSEATGVNWTHAWSSVWSTEASVRFQKDKYQGFNRTDDVTGVGLKANYKFRRWLSFGAEYHHTTRDSSSTVNEYDKNLWLLTATGTM